MTPTPPWLRSLRRAFLAALVVCLAAAPLRAEDPPEALKFFEARVATMSKSCADKLWEVASAAKSLGLHQHATETADVLLQDWEPDHAGARELLGYQRRGKDWAVDPDAKVQRLNTKNEKEAQKSFDDKIRKWKESLAKVNQFIAAKYAAVGAECAAKGWEEQARKAAERALSLDPECEPARKALGYEKFGKLWLTKAKADAVKRAAEGKPVEGESELEKLLGAKLHKIQTPHFRVEDDAGKAVLPEAARNLETLYAYYLADAGRDPTEDVFQGRVVEMCVVSTQPLWERWCDARANYKDPKFLKASNTYRNLTDLRTGTLRVETAESVDTRDPLLHHAAHLLGLSLWKSPRHAWLDEGLAYYYVVKVQDTTRTHCVATEEGGYGKGEPSGGAKDWKLSERWKLFLRDVVKKKDDAELRKILATPLATLDLPSSVKAWGVISWLMDTRREKFLEFLKALRERKDPQTQEELFEKTFATSIEAVDREWRAFAVRAY
jgi:hypothetical protein